MILLLWKIEIIETARPRAAGADLLEHAERVLHRRAASAVAGRQRHRVPAARGGLGDQVDRVHVLGVDVVGDRTDRGAGEFPCGVVICGSVRCRQNSGSAT